MILINILFFLTIIFLLMFIYSFIEKYWIQIKKYHVKIDKKAFDSFNIVFLSDIHHSSIVSLRFIRNIVRKVNALKPDLILLGGDYVSSGYRFVKPVFEELGKLEAKFGVFGVIGNHDVNVSKIKTLAEMKRVNIHSLDNKSYWIYKDHAKIKLGGVADLLLDKPNLLMTTFDTEASDYVILVSHNPDYVEDIKGNKVDLMLSGHTHGGQVTLFGMLAPYIPSSFRQMYRSGLKNVKKTTLIVSNGVGVVGLPIRFFARPQIVQITLTKPI